MQKMNTAIVTAPTVEPVSLTEAKEHIRIDSTSFEDSMTPVQSIAPGAHVIAAAYSLVGASTDILGTVAVVTLNAGTNGTSGTVDVKIQESDDDTTFNDWTDGAFTQVTTSNDSTVYEKTYTGVKRYIKVLATVAVATCDFGVTIISNATTTAEDTYISTLITVARKYVETVCSRKLITQTWNAYPDDFPYGGALELPYGSLQSVTSITYYDVDDTEATISSDDYYVETVGVKGRIVLKDGNSWPSVSLRPSTPIIIPFVCGYGDAGSDVPEEIKNVIKMLIHDLYETRSTEIDGNQDWINVLLTDYRMRTF